MNKSLNTSRGTIFIRQSTVADASNFRDLRLGALLDSPTAFSMDYEQAAKQPIKRWEDSLVMDDNESAMFFAEYSNQLIGMTGIARGRSPKTRHAAEVWGVYVSPGWRGLRIAERLIHSSADWAKARGIVILRLGVMATNQSAIRCYERCGFTTYGTEPLALLYEGKYYDEFLMSMPLDTD